MNTKRAREEERDSERRIMYRIPTFVDQLQINGRTAFVTEDTDIISFYEMVAKLWEIPSQYVNGSLVTLTGEIVSQENFVLIREKSATVLLRLNSDGLSILCQSIPTLTAPISIIPHSPNTNDCISWDQNAVNKEFNIIIQEREKFPEIQASIKILQTPKNLAEPLLLSTKVFRQRKYIPKGVFCRYHSLSSSSLSEEPVLEFKFQNQEHKIVKSLNGLLSKDCYIECALLLTWSTKYELEIAVVYSNNKYIGYLLKEGDIEKHAEKEYQRFRDSKKLPLVLDLDDTLIRSVGDKDGLVNSQNLRFYDKNRIVRVNENITVVLAEGVKEFIKDMSGRFELFVYSAGEPEYVHSIIKALDPNSKFIKKHNIFSAWNTFHRLQRTQGPENRLPTKNLQEVLGFCNRADSFFPTQGSAVLTLPIILDDKPDMWFSNHMANLFAIPPRSDNNSAKTWNNSLNDPKLATSLRKARERFMLHQGQTSIQKILIDLKTRGFLEVSPPSSPTHNNW